MQEGDSFKAYNNRETAGAKFWRKFKMEPFIPIGKVVCDFSEDRRSSIPRDANPLFTSLILKITHTPLALCAQIVNYRNWQDVLLRLVFCVRAWQISEKEALRVCLNEWCVWEWLHRDSQSLLLLPVLELRVCLQMTTLRTIVGDRIVAVVLLLVHIRINSFYQTWGSYFFLSNERWNWGIEIDFIYFLYLKS